MTTTEIPENSLIRQAMDAARELTGLELAYVSEFVEGAQVIRALSGDNEPFGLVPGEPNALESTYCQRMVDGRLQCVVPDTHADPVTGVLAITEDANLGAYVGVPLRLPDGRLYGSFCCISHGPEPLLGERQADLMRMFARLVGDQIQQAQAADATQRTQNAFLAAVSHDLRSPVIALRNLGEDLAAADPGLDPVAAGAVIESEARRVLAMVEDMLLISSERAGALTLNPGPTDLGRLVREAVDAARVAAGAQGDRIAEDVPAGPLEADVDRLRVMQALQNLLENAIKYSPGGGPVEVTLRADGPTATIAVRDQGIGFSAEDAAHLGERFFRAQTATHLGLPGIGLGLATAAAIAALHEGTLTAESTPGEGSTFTLRLPLTRREAR